MNDLIARLFSGDARALASLFTWGDTDQGHKYWRAKADGELPMTAEDFDYIMEFIFRKERT